MKDNYFEEFPKLLDKANIQWEWGKRDKYGFTREIKATILGVNYYFDIFKNLINLSVGVPYTNHTSFTKMEITTHLCDSSKALWMEDINYSITIEPLDWQIKYIEGIPKC